MATYIGEDITVDAKINTVHKVAQQAILPFATLEWADLAPSLVSHVHDVVEALPAGVMLQESLEGPCVEGSAAVVPTASQMLTQSLAAAAPHSRSPLTGSGVSPHQAVVDITNCLACLLPCRVIPTEVPSVVIPVVASSFARPVSTAPSPIAGPVAAACLSKKRPAYEPLPHHSSKWCTCAWCNRRKSKCQPLVGAQPPYSSCAICLNLRQPCIPGPAKMRQVHKVPPSKPVAAVASSGSRALDRPLILLLQMSFLTQLPSLPLHSSSKAPLGDLIAWHTEIERVMAEHAAACLA